MHSSNKLFSRLITLADISLHPNLVGLYSLLTYIRLDPVRKDRNRYKIRECFALVIKIFVDIFALMKMYLII